MSQDIIFIGALITIFGITIMLIAAGILFVVVAIAEKLGIKDSLFGEELGEKTP